MIPFCIPSEAANIAFNKRLPIQIVKFLLYDIDFTETRNYVGMLYIRLNIHFFLRNFYIYHQLLNRLSIRKRNWMGLKKKIY